MSTAAAIRNKVDRIVEISLVTLMSVMVVNVLWQVFSRYILQSPSIFTDELARYLMIWLGVLGAAYMAGKDLHIAINLIPARLNEKSQRRLKLFSDLLIALFTATAFVIGGSRLVYITHILDQNSPALGLPLAGIYLIIPISGLLIVFYKVLDLQNGRS